MPPKSKKKMVTQTMYNPTINGMAGGNIFHDIYNKVLVPTHDFVKKNKLISRGLALVPGPYGKIGAVAANQLGYGKASPRFQ